jgi:uncharacterized protein (TIGR02444 family)
VQKECAELQNSFGIDINLLLFCGFVGAVHRALLPKEDLSDAIATVAQWQRSIVGPLRATRRTLKQLAPPHNVVEPLVKDLRVSVKSIELEAERIEQIALEAWCLSRLDSWPRLPQEIAVPANIRTLFALGGASTQQIALPDNVIAAARIASFQRGK